MKKLLIITGPQGSGNHVFSKCFAVHENAFGWKSLLDTYWEGHHHEPFADAWEDTELLHEFDWDQSDYFVTSVSTPYFKNKEAVIPNFERFINVAKKYVDTVEVAIIGRDQNILKLQQERVRKEHTTPVALDAFKWLLDTQSCTFLSQELLYLYKHDYLKQLSKELDWMIAHWDPRIDEILKEDANNKYVSNVKKEHWLDLEVHRAVRES